MPAQTSITTGTFQAIDLTPEVSLLVGRSAPTRAYLASLARFVTSLRHPYPSPAPIAKSRDVQATARGRKQVVSGDTQIRENNVKLLSFSLAGAALLASMGASMAQDAAAGEKVFVQMQGLPSCLPRPRRTWSARPRGVVGRKAGTASGYHYSEANEKSGITWDEAELKKYLKDPKGVGSGDENGVSGLKSDEDIDNVIAYLKQFGPDGKKI